MRLIRALARIHKELLIPEDTSKERLQEILTTMFGDDEVVFIEDSNHDPEDHIWISVTETTSYRFLRDDLLPSIEDDLTESELIEYVSEQIYDQRDPYLATILEDEVDETQVREFLGEEGLLDSPVY